MELMEVVARARAADDPQQILDLIPYAGTLGVGYERIEGELTFVLRYRDSNIGNPQLPALHGGVVGGFMEQAAILHLLWREETAVLPKVIDFAIDYLRPGRPRDTYARCTVWRQGKRVANVAVEAWQSEVAKSIATARAHFLLA